MQLNINGKRGEADTGAHMPPLSLHHAVTSVRISRRRFLLSRGEIVIGVALGIPALAAADGADAATSPLKPNHWVGIGTDGIVTIVSPAAEIGQGSMTAVPLCLAEDLDADWGKVKVVQAGANAGLIGNQSFGGAQATGGAHTTGAYYEALRLAGAQTRQLLLMAAAERWKAPLAELSTTLGIVVHRRSGRSMSYGEIAGFAEVPAVLPPVSVAMLKPLDQCRYLGKGVARLDLAAKATGKAVFGIDVRRDGMPRGAEWSNQHGQARPAPRPFCR
ncbi:MAG: molybdopterin cofactor-binding domain-containing protein [Pseudomonadota bacterium]